MCKTLIIGLDLSFASTGLVMSEINNNIGEKISFYKIVFDDNSNKRKKYVPTKIKNVNIITYRMPSNILVSDLCLDIDDMNNMEQTESTLKAMICSKKIGQILYSKINDSQFEKIIVVIEGYIMPVFSGQNQLKIVSGLIMLQGFVREIIIKISLEKNIPLKMFTPAPKSNKLFFAHNGNAEKQEMLKVFLEDYEGNKLLPDITINSVAKINDVIDAFSLMMFGYAKTIKIK
jgi:hypothetical protein